MQVDAVAISAVSGSIRVGTFAGVREAGSAPRGALRRVPSQVVTSEVELVGQCGTGYDHELSQPVQRACAAALSRGEMAGTDARRVDDALLIREAQQGNRAAFEELIRQYDQAVLRLALRLTGSEQDALDIYQEAFLKAFRSIGKFRFECSFYTWIYRIVTNLCLDHLRKRKVRKEQSAIAVNAEGEETDLLLQVPDVRSGADPERDLMRRELGAKIQNALGGLSGRERMVFELKHYQGLKLKTIGEILDTTEETAKNTLFRATQKLRIALAEMK